MPKIKTAVYNYRSFDEAKHFDYFKNELDMELAVTDRPPLAGINTDMAKGCDAISIITSPVDKNLIMELYDIGIRYISTRTIGYDHIDIAACKDIGMHVGNAPYEPNGVADYTIMLMLMCIRHMKRIMERAVIQDYTLPGIIGGELKDYTIGIIGTGRIGTTVCRDLSGFGSKLLAYDIHENDEATKYATYVSLDEILEKSDIISLHMPLLDTNAHMINRDTLSRMKDGVIIVNTARGGLLNTPDILDALECGKIGALGLDVVENEAGLYYNDLRYSVLKNRELLTLREYPNVVVTPHMAWYTDNAVREMVQISLISIDKYVRGEENPWLVC